MRSKLALILLLLVAYSPLCYGQAVLSNTIDTKAGVAWSDLLAIFSLFTGIVGAIQWVIVRVMIEPMLLKQTETLKAWAETKFPANAAFDSHVKSDDERQERNQHEIDKLQAHFGIVPNKPL